MWPAAVFTLCSLGLSAQTRPAFEAASVRPSKSDAPASSLFPLGPGDAYTPGSLFSAVNQPLIAYLRFAYKLGQGDLLDLPAWVYSDRFDIEARAEGNPTKDQMRLMMRSLLVSRFKVAAHTESRPRPVFDLVLATRGKTGPSLQPHGPDETCSATPSVPQLPQIPCGSLGQIAASAPGRGRLGGRAVIISRIAGILTNPFTGVDRPVEDRTGLTGTFDFNFEWSLTRDSAAPPDPRQSPSLPEDTGPGFLEALREQLGLKLVSSKAPVDVLVIDRVERPGEN